MRYDLHAQRHRPRGHLTAHPAKAYYAQRFARQLAAHKAVLAPHPVAQQGMGLRDVPGQREHQGDGVLGGSLYVAVGRVDHRDAVLCGRTDVNVVHADACPAHYL